jgi:hypothetical protein
VSPQAFYSEISKRVCNTRAIHGILFPKSANIEQLFLNSFKYSRVLVHKIPDPDFPRLRKQRVSRKRKGFSGALQNKLKQSFYSRSSVHTNVIRPKPRDQSQSMDYIKFYVSFVHFKGHFT